MSFSRSESPPLLFPNLSLFLWGCCALQMAADISFLPVTLAVVSPSKSPGLSINLTALQSAGVKRNYCCSLLGWARWNYPKAVFIMPLNLVPMFNVLSTLTPGVSLLRCSPRSHPTVCGWLGGSSLTSVLLVFIHIKSWISDCLLPIFLNSLWFSCSLASLPSLSFSS